jgi:hypothetical protein
VRPLALVWRPRGDLYRLAQKLVFCNSDLGISTTVCKVRGLEVSQSLFWTWKHKHAHKVHVYEVYAHEVHAYEVHAYDMYACEVHACEVHAREAHAHETRAYELHALEVYARKILEKTSRSPILQTVVRCRDPSCKIRKGPLLARRTIRRCSTATATKAAICAGSEHSWRALFNTTSEVLKPQGVNYLHLFRRDGQRYGQVIHHTL